MRLFKRMSNIPHFALPYTETVFTLVFESFQISFVSSCYCVTVTVDEFPLSRSIGICVSRIRIGSVARVLRLWPRCGPFACLYLRYLYGRDMHGPLICLSIRYAVHTAYFIGQESFRYATVPLAERLHKPWKCAEPIRIINN